MLLFGPTGISRVSFALRLKYPNEMLYVPSGLRYQPSKTGVTVWPVARMGASISWDVAGTASVTSAAAFTATARRSFGIDKELRIQCQKSNRWHLDVPDVAAVIPDRAIGREVPHARHVEDAHARPFAGIGICVPDALLTLDICLVVREHQERIVPEERIHERLEQVGLLGRELARRNLVERLA